MKPRRQGGNLDAHAARFHERAWKLTVGCEDVGKAEVQEMFEQGLPGVSAMGPAQTTFQEHAAYALAAVTAGSGSHIVRAVLRAVVLSIVTAEEGSI